MSTREDETSSSRQPPEAEALKDQGRRAAMDVRDEAYRYAEQGKSQLGATTEDVAGAMRDGAAALDNRGQSQLAAFTRSGANRMTTLADQLRNRHSDDLLRDAQHFARENAALFVGGSIAVGFTLARLMKVSAPEAADRGASSASGGSAGASSATVPPSAAQASSGSPGGDGTSSSRAPSASNTDTSASGRGEQSTL